MRSFFRGFIYTLVLCCIILLSGCDYQPSSDQIQQQQQEKILAQGTAEIGMPAIKNFREKKLLKAILEMRDQENLVTYTYIMAENTGKLIYLGETIGYGIPYATQFTSPEKADWHSSGGYIALPQADPNGLFSPAEAEGTWILMKDPGSNDVKPIYVEPRVIVSPFKLPDALLAK
jgi:hypothetical protein